MVSRVVYQEEDSNRSHLKIFQSTIVAEPDYIAVAGCEVAQINFQSLHMWCDYSKEAK